MNRNDISYLFKKFLTLLGARASARRLWQCQMIVDYMKLGRWMSSHGFQVNRRVRNRTAVFDAVIRRIHDRRVLYLEFGVNTGDSMRHWSKALKHPEAMLHGFDSFEGLPEDFDVDGPIVMSTHSNERKPPSIDDSRVRFFVGWFDEVLPTYQLPEHDVLVIVLDADLYSSTMCVLDHLRDHIRPGTFVYFDELSRVEHEPRAFAEFMRESGLRFRLVSVENSLNRAFFECLG